MEYLRVKEREKIQLFFQGINKIGDTKLSMLERNVIFKHNMAMPMR